MYEILVSVIDFLASYIIWVYVACALICLYNLRNYVIARRARVNTIFSVEREVSAHREGRSMANIGLTLGIVALVLVAQQYVLPSMEELDVMRPTEPTATLSIPTQPPPTPTPDEVAVVEAQPTAVVPTPVPEPTPVPPPTPEPDPEPPPPPVPPPSACRDPNTCITSPGSNARLSGSVTVRGTARHADFQFYKIEHGVGENPQAWHSIGDVVRSQVSDGVLLQFDSRAFPNGVYWLMLTVVDSTGNFPPPHRVRVVIEN